MLDDGYYAYGPGSSIAVEMLEFVRATSLLGSTDSFARRAEGRHRGGLLSKEVVEVGANGLLAAATAQDVEVAV